MDGRRGLSLDVGGTLMTPAEPVGETYARLGRPWGVRREAAAIDAAFRAALRTAASGDGPRQTGDGRAFWRGVVAEATGVADEALFEQLYGHYRLPGAWRLAPGALEALERLAAGGVGVVIASNWDTRLEPTLEALGVRQRVRAVVCSGALGVEKPDPRFFAAVCAALGLPPERVVHLGDSPRDDVAGARAAGLEAWRWGEDVHSFDAVAARLLG